MSSREPFDFAAAAAAWRRDEPAPDVAATVAARIRRHTKVMWVTTVAETAVLAGLAAFTVWFGRTGITPAEIALLAAVWTLSLGTFAFAIGNRRGSWRAAAEAPAAYVDLIERRARAKLRTVYAVRALVVAQSVVVVGLAVARAGGSVERGLVAAALAAVMTAACIGWSFWYAARVRAELLEATRLRALVDASSADDEPTAPV